MNPLCRLIGMNKNSLANQGEIIVDALNTAIDKRCSTHKQRATRM